MKITHHLKYTAVLSIVLLYFWDLKQIFLFSLGSILIDIDHCVFYVLQFRTFNVRKLFDYYNEWLPNVKDKIPYAGICIFHTIEIYIIVSIISIYTEFVFYLLVGMIFHFMLDFISLYKTRCLFLRAHSIVEHFIRIKKHVKYGYPLYDLILKDDERFQP